MSQQSWRAVGQFIENDGDVAKGKERLANAYKTVFSGGGSKAQAQMVLAHLSQVTGFFATVPSDRSNEVLREHNAKRGVFGEILRFIDMSPDEMAALQKAVHAEKGEPL